LHLLGFFARQHDIAFAVFRAFEQHVDDVAGLHRDVAVLVDEFVYGNDPFRLVADVDDDFGRRHFEHRPLHDLAFRDVAEAVIVKVQKARVFLRINLIVYAGCATSLRNDLLLFVCCHAQRVLSQRTAGISAPAGCRFATTWWAISSRLSNSYSRSVKEKRNGPETGAECERPEDHSLETKSGARRWGSCPA